MGQEEARALRELCQQLGSEVDARNRELELRVDDQQKRGRELESLILKVQRLEHDDLNRLKRVLHEKVESDRERSEREDEKARVLFQELARLGDEFRDSFRRDSQTRSEIVKRVAQLETGQSGERQKWG